MGYETLGKLIHIKHGYAFKSEYFSLDTGTQIVLTPGNFFEEGGFKLRPDKDRFYTGDFPKDFVLKRNDIIIAMTEQTYGLLGSPAIISENDKYLHNQRLGKFELLDKKRVFLRFLYYLFCVKSLRDEISISATGTKIRHTAPERIYKIKVPLPVLAIQRKIAAVLSAYDDLIENNNRRIAILEKMAEELYREWFVRLRFPGHEKTKIIKGMPHGWEVKKLSDIVELAYGKALKEEDRIDGPYPVYGSSGIVGFHNHALVKGPGIIVGRKGNVGSVTWSNLDYFPIDTTYYLKSKIPLEYLYYLIQSMNFINNDAAVPGLNRRQAYANKFYCPLQSLMDNFVEMAKPFLTQKESLKKQNELLVISRDRLLSRLMSGKIDVENMDIQFPASMQEEATADA